MDLIAQLKKSLDDDYLADHEKKELRLIVENQSLDSEAISILRAKIYDLAREKATASNYQFVMEWMKDANNVLRGKPGEHAQIFFSPGEFCRNAIIEQMNNARRKLKICVFTISDDLITEAILKAHRRRIEVRIITDNDKSFDHGSDIRQLADEGIGIRVDVTSNHMHHKFMIADDLSLVNGSYNWTRSAARFNHENIIVTRERGTVKSFVNEFEKLWQEMKVYEM